MASTRTFGDNIAEQSTTVGNGTYQLEGPLTGYRAFSDAYVLNDAPYYAVRNAQETKFEYNKGTTVYTPGGPATLSRAVWLSSNANAAVVWDADDLPLTIYCPTSGEVFEGLVTGFLATARNALIRMGSWLKKDDQGAGLHSWKFYDGASDIHLGVIDTVNHKFVYPLRRGDIKGLSSSVVLANVTILAGYCRDSTDTTDIFLNSSLVKDISATWATGSTHGGRASGVSLTSLTTYHLFIAIINGVTDAFWDTSATAANKPTGTTAFRRIWSNVTSSSAAIIKAYVQRGDVGYFTGGWTAASTSGNGDFPVMPVGPGSWTTWTPAVGAAPRGVIFKYKIRGYVFSSSSSCGIQFEHADMPGGSSPAYTGLFVGVDQDGIEQEVYCDVNGAVQFIYTGSVSVFWFQVAAWTDRRGQDD